MENNALDFLTEDPGRALLFIESQATGTLRTGRQQLTKLVAALVVSEAPTPAHHRPRNRFRLRTDRPDPRQRLPGSPRHVATRR
ncbi:hypothetical protein ACFWWS_37880, partial [Streptomyces sp. NPDC059083]|uniref:hypothetical protein n=1 Tax=Streptomyces sp. NPDC059083 TaxID=3346721 RepID=UPI0036A906DA